MKKRHLLIALSSLLIVGGTLVGCDQTQEVLSYSVTHNSSTDFKVVGLKASGYVPGEKVTFGVVPNEGKVVESISYGSLQITKESEEVYTFSMPTEAVNLNIVVADYSDEYTVLDSALEGLKTGFEMDAVYIENQLYTYNDGSTYASRYAKRVINQVIDGYDLVTRYESAYDYSGETGDIDVSETEPDVMYMFSRNKETGYLSTTYLGIDNTIHQPHVLDTATDAYINWTSTYDNPFNILTSADFTVDEADATIYHLDTTNLLLEPVYRNLATLIFGEYNSSYIVNELAVKLENGALTSFEGSFEVVNFAWYQSTITFKGEFTKIGAVMEEPTVVSGEEDADLEATFDSLKEGNFTTVCTEITTDWYDNVNKDSTKGYSDGGDHFLQEIYDTNKVIGTDDPSEVYYYETIEEYDDFSETYQYSVKQAVKIRDEFYIFSSDRENIQIKENMLPSFEISSVLFTKGEDGTYSFKEDLPYYFVPDTSSVFSTFTENSIGNLTIELATDSVTIKNVSSYAEEEVVFTDIGTTTVTVPTINTTTDKLTKWEDYMKTEAIATELLSYVPTEVLNIVPTPITNVGSIITNAYFYYSSYYEETNVVIALDVYGDYPDLQAQDLIVYYANALGEQGFIQDLEETDYYNFVKEMDVSGVPSTVTISLSPGSSTFTVTYKIEEIQTSDAA